MTLVKEEVERYSRQILLYGRGAQERLKASRVVVIGAGGLGSTLLPLLAASGVGSIAILDADTVERANLGRQIMFREADLGREKAIVAAEFLRLLNPHVEIRAEPRAFSGDDAALVARSDFVCEGSDSIATKFLANDLALALKKPLLVGALGKSQGHAMLIANPAAACYRCIFDELPAGELPTCASEGILSTFPAVVAAQMAHLAVNHLLGVFESGLWVFEKNHCRKVRIKKRPNCNHEESINKVENTHDRFTPPF